MGEDQTLLVKTQSALGLGLILVLAIIFLPTPGTADVFDWLGWGSNVYNNGLVKGYALNHHEHPPYFSALLYVALAIADGAGIAPFYGLKITFLIALIASTAIIYFWSRRDTSLTLVFFAPLAYSCLTLSYMDIYFTPFFLLSIYFASNNKFLQAAIAFMAASLIKFPPLIVAPFFLVYACSHFISNNPSHREAIKQLAMKIIIPMSVMLFVTLAIFGNELFSALLRSFGHNCLSCGALNFNQLFPVFLYEAKTGQNIFLAFINQTNWLIPYQQDDALLYSIARITFVAFYAVTLIAFIFREKNISTLLIFCILAHFSYFVFSKGVHENHLYLSMLLAMCLAIIDKKHTAMALNIIVISSMNMFVIYGMNGMAFDLWWTKDYYNGEIESLSWLNAGYPFEKRLILSLFNVVYFLVFWLAWILFPRRSQKNYRSQPIFN